MTKRFDLEETSRMEYESCRSMVEREDGEFVHYPDYEKLVDVVRGVILDFDHDGTHPIQKRKLEKVLVDLKEEI